MRPASAALRGVRNALRQLPLLPAFATFLLVGLSVYASFGGGSGNGNSGNVDATKASRELRSMGFDEIARATPPVPVPRVTCEIGDAKYRGFEVRAGATNMRGSAEACRRSCKHAEGCNAWRWCEDHQGCSDIRGNAIPWHGCHLEAEALRPSGIPADRRDLQERLAPRSYTSGFLKHRNYNQSTFLRTQSAAGTKLVLTTYVPPADCTNAEGKRVAAMSVLNKQDYARWHGYDFHLEARTADAELRPKGSSDEGSWNKIGIIRKLLAANTEAEAEWILWMEPDAIFDDPSFTFPFEFYQGKDIVTVADPEAAEQGKAKALSTGVLLLRNSKWTREFLEDLAEFARNHPKIEDEEGGGGSDPVAAGMMAVLKKRGLSEELQHFRFEGEFCLACDWRKIDLRASAQVSRTTSWGEQNKNWKLFVTRFFDCEACWAGATPPQALASCLRSYREHYTFAYCRFHRMSQAIERELRDGSFLQQLEEQQIAGKGFNYTAFSQQPNGQEGILASPLDHHTASAQECHDACMQRAKCGRWIWCSHSSGCDAMGTFRGDFPRHGCHLSIIDNTRSPYLWDRGPQFSSFSSGYIPDDHPSRIGWAGKIVRKAASTNNRLAIASGLPTAPCSTPYGDLVIRLAVQNRQDYVRIHGQELHLMAESVDPHLRMGAWQKLGFMKKLLAEIPRERAEWIAWMDMDIVIDDMLFDIPLAKYEGKDFVIWGRRDKITEGDVLNGVNSGVFLVRNTDWSRQFLEAWTPFGQFPPDFKYDEMLRAKIVNFDIGMFEQNVIAYLVMQQPELLDRIEFEGDYCINCWYKDAFKSNIAQPPFIVHFAGCQVCTGFHPEKLGDCDRELVRVYLDSHRQLRNFAAGKAIT